MGSALNAVENMSDAYTLELSSVISSVPGGEAEWPEVDLLEIAIVTRIITSNQM